ncbi:MAG: AraC family transcriptional regulator [Labilithrix sp.]
MIDLRVETSAAGAKRRHQAGRPSFVLPLHASVVAARTGGIDALLDAASWLLVPAGEPLRLETRSPLATVLVMTLTPALERLVAETYAGEIEPKVMKRVLATAVIVPRTTWVSEIAQRYAFEREQCRKSGNTATTFLETELLKEWYFVRREANERRSHLEKEPPLLERAQRYIDAHLADPITVATLAKVTHASPSAVLRAFRQGVGMAPATYLRARRLDEALLLIRSGRYAVGEVASRVGYGSFAAFSQAFRARFRKPPSAFR